mmetsp:Transcript_8462/g.22999  ORF Transcript_8462/g.22999 Transcript_8462/m.22999 type:complete len:361 (+) Transcript_8462:327-1409(+)
MAASRCSLHRAMASTFSSFLAMASSTFALVERSRALRATPLIRFQMARESQPRGPRSASACSATARGVTMPRWSRASSVISRRCPETRQNSKAQRTMIFEKACDRSSSSGRSFENTFWYPSSILLMCVGVFAPFCSIATANSSTTASSGHGSEACSAAGSPAAATPAAAAAVPSASSSCFGSSFTAPAAPSPSLAGTAWPSPSFAGAAGPPPASASPPCGAPSPAAASPSTFARFAGGAPGSAAAASAARFSFRTVSAAWASDIRVSSASSLTSVTSFTSLTLAALAASRFSGAGVALAANRSASSCWRSSLVWVCINLRQNRSTLWSSGSLILARPRTDLNSGMACTGRSVAASGSGGT